MMFSNALVVEQAGGTVLAYGNAATCSAVGFLVSLGFYCSTLFTAALAMCHLLMVNFRWNEDRFRGKRMRFLFLCAPPLVMLPQLIIFVVKGAEELRNNYFASCDNISNQDAWLRSVGKWSTVIIVWPTLLCVPTVMVCMLLLYRHVLEQERRNDRYSFSGEVHRTQSNHTAIQGICYVLAFLIIKAPWIAYAVYRVNSKTPPQRFGWGQALIDLQGFFNALVYLRPRFVAYLKRRYPTKACMLWSRRSSVHLTEPVPPSSQLSLGTETFLHSCSPMNSGDVNPETQQHDAASVAEGCDSQLEFNEEAGQDSPNSCYRGD